jgi:DNA polymerase IIIc chi subunit
VALEEALAEAIGRRGAEFQEDADRGSARERVKFYKDRGYEVSYFDLSGR